MNRYEAQAILEQRKVCINCKKDLSCSDCKDNISGDIEEALEIAIKALEDRPQGKWIEVKDKFAYATYYHWDCSVCKTQYGKTYNFCPNCGARMEEENT